MDILRQLKGMQPPTRQQMQRLKNAAMSQPGGVKVAKPNGDIVGGVNLGVQVDKMFNNKTNLQGKPDNTVAAPISSQATLNRALKADNIPSRLTNTDLNTIQQRLQPKKKLPIPKQKPR